MPNRSPVFRRYLRDLFLGLLVAIGTVALGFLPHDDLLQGAWVLGSTGLAATAAYRRRLSEDDEARYTRIASQKFAYWIKQDPDLVQGLFASNVPRSVTRWFEAETGCNVEECRGHHVVDSFARKGDEPGQLVFRAGLELGRLAGRAEREGRDLAEALSDDFERLAIEWRSALGESVHPGVHFVELKTGDRRPVGVHLSTEDSRCLAVAEAFERPDGTTIQTVSMGLDSVWLGSLSADDWDRAREIVYGELPYFQPALGGSGPQKQRVPLFIAERPLDDDELAAFPQLVVRAYESLVAAFPLPSPPGDEEPRDSSPNATESTAPPTV